jgi:hypothetical protein
VTDSTINDNTTTAGGGGISNNGTLTVISSTISNNSTTGVSIDGGGIYNRFGGKVTLTSSSINNNTTTGSGGGIANSGTLTVTDSTISGNTASGDGFQGGGGIVNDSSSEVVVTNSTISGNSAPGEFASGGGVRNISAAEVTFRNSTISDNSASSVGGTGGGIYNENTTLTLANTIIANSTAGREYDRDYHGTALTLQGNNIVEDGSVTGGNVINADPNLGPLQDNGGPTLTHLPLAGSPAINAGVNAEAQAPDGSPLTTDQRGSTRIVGSSVDIGAVEVQTDEMQPPMPTPTSTPTSTTETPTVTPEPGAITLNFSSGAPGSVFVLTVPNLPAGSSATIALRAPGADAFAPLRTLTVPENGTLEVLLQTESNDPLGTYTILVNIQSGDSSVMQATTRQISFELDSAEPVRDERPADIPTVEIQVGGEILYLPLIQQ